MTLAFYSSDFPYSGDGTQGRASGIYYMGPDYPTSSAEYPGIWGVLSSSRPLTIFSTSPSAVGMRGPFIDGVIAWPLCVAYTDEPQQFWDDNQTKLTTLAGLSSLALAAQGFDTNRHQSKIRISIMTF